MRKCLQSITEAGHLRESHPRGFLRLGGRLWEVVVYERWIHCSVLYKNS